MLTKEMLRKLRTERGLTGKQVAENIGIAYPVYQTYESGVRNAGLPVVEKLADFYGVTTDYLLGREPAKPDPFKELGIDRESEQKMLAQYMALPEYVRATLMDTLVQLAGAVSPDEPEQEQKESCLEYVGTVGDFLKSQKTAEQETA